MRNLDEERQMAAQNEYDILKMLSHKNIVQVKKFYITDIETYNVMEYVDGKELLDKICEIEKYDENIA
jgi:serine/threonine protein kinase